jgi:hypothetical protein
MFSVLGEGAYKNKADGRGGGEFACESNPVGGGDTLEGEGALHLNLRCCSRQCQNSCVHWREPALPLLFTLTSKRNARKVITEFAQCHLGTAIRC